MLTRILPLLLVLMPATASAAPRNFEEFAKLVVGILDIGTGVLILFGLVAYFWGIAVSIPEFGEEKGAEKRKSFFFWGIVVLFVMVSVWGIVKLINNTLFGGGGGAPDVGGAQVENCTSFDGCTKN